MKTAEGTRNPVQSGPASGYYGPEKVEQEEPLDSALAKSIDEYVASHPGGQERLIPLLHLAQSRIGWLPSNVQEYIADSLGMSPVQVFGVVSFYHFFATSPRGHFQLKVCTGTACFVRGAMDLVAELEKLLKIEVGGVTEDRMFSLEQVRCIGACGLAPALMIDNEVHGNLTRKDLKRLVRGLKKSARQENEERSEADGVQ
jgi:NADH-quinone oxidoreductase subunit E/NADP-reducing hydrogenase subunit HndA